jgi:hypothetical protein
MTVVQHVSFQYPLRRRKKSMQQQEMSSASGSTHEPLTFRTFVDMIIVFGSIPALVLTLILCALAVAFSHAGALPTILTLIVTLLLACIAIVLIVRYVDVAGVQFQNANAHPANDEYGMMGVGAIFVCLYMAVSTVVCLSLSGTLEGWHYTQIAISMLLVGYQTWRAFLGNND